MRGIQSELSEGMGGAGSSAGQKAGSSFVSKFKTLIAAAGIGKLFTQTITEGMDLQQNLGGTEVVFGEFAKTVQEQAKQAYKNMGTSASDYMATANKMASLFQGSGLEQERSMDLTTKAMQRAADVASVMGIDTATAMESIAGAAKGNFTMMDNLGVAMNATTLEAYALSKGLDFAWNSASNAEKAELAMQMFFENTEQYAGNFARESEETIAGSIGAMKAAAADLMGNLALGEDIRPSLINLKDTFITFAVNNLLPTVVSIIGSLPLLIGSIFSGLPGKIIPALFESVKQLLTQLGDAIPTLFNEFIVSDLPALIETLMNVFTEGVPMLLTVGSQLIMGLLNGIITELPTIIGYLPSIIETVVSTLISGVSLVMDAGMQILNAFVSAIPLIIPVLAEQIPTIIDSIVTSLVENIGVIIEGAMSLFSGIIAAIPMIIPVLVEAIPTIVNAVTTTLVTNLPLLIEAAITMFNGIIQAMPTILNELALQLSSIITMIVTTLLEAGPAILGAALEALLSIAKAIPEILSTLGENMRNLGQNLVSGLWQGISNSYQWIKDKISGWVGNVMDFIKNLFGIHSPSTKTAWMGGMLARGLAQGISAGIGEISKAISDVTRMTTGTFETGLNINAAGTLSGASFSLDNASFTASAAFVDEVRALGAKIENMQVVLDTGRTVGGLLTETDRQLGGRQILTARGVS